MRFPNLSLQDCEKNLIPIMPFLPLGSKVLDVGAGNGANAQLISKKCQVTAVEPDESGFEMIKKRGIKCVNAKLSEANLKDKYDKILFLKFNIPFVEILPSLKKAKTLLTEDGEIIFDIYQGEYGNQSLNDFTKMFEVSKYGMFI